MRNDSLVLDKHNLRETILYSLVYYLLHDCCTCQFTHIRMPGDATDEAFPFWRSELLLRMRSQWCDTITVLHPLEEFVWLSWRCALFGKKEVVYHLENLLSLRRNLPELSSGSAKGSVNNRIASTWSIPRLTDFCFIQCQELDWRLGLNY